MFYHRYVGEGGDPLVKCVTCGADLAKEDGVQVTFSSGSHTWEQGSSLDDSGTLIDVDGLVEKGLHSGTTCTECGQDLVEYEEA
jgi:hypothetical protein